MQHLNKKPKTIGLGRLLATWCGPCRMQGPILDKLSEELSEDVLKIVKMDVDENPNTARAFGIMSIPTLLFKKDGQVVKQVAGVHTRTNQSDRC